MPWDHVFDDAVQYCGAYLDLLRRGAEAVNPSKISCAAAILDDPALGVICESSAESLAEAILSRTPEDEIVRMSHETLRREAAERYSWDRVGPEIVGVLEATEAESGSGNR